MARMTSQASGAAFEGVESCTGRLTAQDFHCVIQ
jgi:hypothetical protein